MIIFFRVIENLGWTGPIFLGHVFIPISSAVEPKRLRPGFGDSEPLEDFPVGDEPFSKFFRSPPESSCKKGKKHPNFR